MLFLVNPGGRPKRRARPARKATGRKTSNRRQTVAKRKRNARGRFTKARSSTRRKSTARRRSRSRVSMSHPRSVVISNPVRRRRRRHVARKTTTRRRRSYRRNPSLSLRSVMGVAVEGGIIVAGQWGTARIAELVAGKIIPASFSQRQPLAATAVANITAAVGASLIARKVAPRQARLLSAAAWAQAITSTLSATQLGARILAGNLAAPAPALVSSATGAGVSGYAPGARRLAGYSRSGYNVTAGRQEDGMAGYANSGRSMSGGGF